MIVLASSIAHSERWGKPQDFLYERLQSCFSGTYKVKAGTTCIIQNSILENTKTIYMVRYKVWSPRWWAQGSSKDLLAMSYFKQPQGSVASGMALVELDNPRGTTDYSIDEQTCVAHTGLTKIRRFKNGEVRIKGKYTHSRMASESKDMDVNWDCTLTPN